MSGRKVVQFFFKRCFHNKPDFTKNQFRVTRGNYNHLDENHIIFFQELLGTNRTVMDLSDLEKYNIDWYLQMRGSSSIVLKPKTTEEVSKILSFCNRNRLAVCPQGGNTSAVGGSVPVFDEIILSAELLNEIISLDEFSGALVCQSGCTLESIDRFVALKNLTVPLDIASRGTCQIGGNVSTNAGGMRLFRYGNLHGNVLGLEVVKPDGEILDLMTTLRKDNTGFHLKNLFIGAEGTLGFITKVVIQCPSLPKCKHLAFLGLQSFDKVLKTFTSAKADLGEIVSAVEVLDSPTLDFIQEFNKLESPIGDYPFYLLIETAGSNEEHDFNKLNSFFEQALNKHLILNGTVVQEPSKMEAIWKIRDLSSGFRVCGPILLYDVSLPLKDYYNLVDIMRQYLDDLSPRVFGFGHLGDGNLHLNIQLTRLDTEVRNRVEDFLFKKIVDLKGSMSAEHGLGFPKSKYLALSKADSVVRLMRNLKRTFDPNGIMNPYKVFP